MVVLEWWYPIDRAFVAHPSLLDHSFATHVAGRSATLHLPSLPPAGSGIGTALTQPRVGGRPAAEPSDQWGMVHIRTTEGVPEGVAVEQLAFTAGVSDSDELQDSADSFVDAMDEWWENVSTWLAVATGQTLSGHQPTEYLGSRVPIWALDDNHQRRHPITIPLTIYVTTSKPVIGVSPDILQACAALAAETPHLAWTLLRDARAQHQAGQHRRAVIDAATAAELAVTELLNKRLRGSDDLVSAALLRANRMLGPRSKLLASLGCPPVPQAFWPDLVEPRNEAMHKGEPIESAAAAISVAAEIVERAFPLPTTPANVPGLTRLWT